MEEGMNNWGCGGVLMWVLVIFALMGGGGFGNVHPSWMAEYLQCWKCK